MPWIASFYQRTPQGRTLYRRIILSPTVELWQHKLGDRLVSSAGEEIHKSTLIDEPVIEWREEVRSG